MSSFLCRIVGSVPSFFSGGEPREDGARREKSETKSSRENSRKRRIVVSSSKELQRLLFLVGKKRVFETFFSTKERKIFYLFFK